MEKILAVDVGLKRIGLALCMLKPIVTPLEGIIRTNATQAAQAVDKVALEYGCNVIVLGMPPQNTSMAKSVKHFKTLLTFDGKIVFENEDNSSIEAWDILKEQRATRGSKKLNNKDTKLDSMSACIILKRYIGEI